MAREEYKKALKCGLDKELADLKSKKAPKTESEEVVAPPKEVVTEGIAGVDILDLEDAVKALWKDGIYAESGMGCTGPIVLVNEAKGDLAVETLVKAGYTAK